MRAVEQLKRDGRALTEAGTRIQLEYSPESFTSTELEFALEICEAVTDVWGPEYADDVTVLRGQIANLRRKIEPPQGPRRHYVLSLIHISSEEPARR